jgi:predicted acylesterase/phospholipase RssA
MTMRVALGQLAATTGLTAAQIQKIVAVEAPKLADRIYAQIKRERLVLVLSGGAPHSPLMAGALCALHEQIGSELNGGKGRFDAIYTSGGGALVGLLLVASKAGNPPQAFRNMLKMGIADPIYRMFPLAYKTFVKPGPLVPVFQEWGELFKRSTSHMPFFRSTVTTALKLWGGPSVASSPVWSTFGTDDPDRRLFDDWVDLVFSALAPTTLTPWSAGLCELAPFLEDLVDFKALKKYKGQFYLNAFNLSKGTEERFTRQEIDAAHVRAALAYPFIYPPGRIRDTLYSEGATHDPLLMPQGRDPRFPEGIEDPLASMWFDVMESAFTDHLRYKPEVTPRGSIVCIDILGNLGKTVLREPRDLWDAYGLSMIAPIVELAQKDRARFREVDNHRIFQGWYDQLEVPFDFKSAGPRILDWSYSNMCRMWDLGYEAGVTLCNTYGKQLRLSSPKPSTRKSAS